MLVNFAALRLMAFPDWDLVSVLTPENTKSFSNRRLFTLSVPAFLC